MTTNTKRLGKNLVTTVERKCNLTLTLERQIDEEMLRETFGDSDSDES